MAGSRSARGRRSTWSSIAAARIGARSCCSSSEKLDESKTGRGKRFPRPIYLAKVQGRLLGLLNTHAGTGADIDAPGVLQEDQANEQRHHRDADRIPEPGIDIAGRGHERGREQWQHAAEP